MPGIEVNQQFGDWSLEFVDKHGGSAIGEGGSFLGVTLTKEELLELAGLIRAQLDAKATGGQSAN